MTYPGNSLAAAVAEIARHRDMPLCHASALLQIAVQIGHLEQRVVELTCGRRP